MIVAGVVPLLLVFAVTALEVGICFSASVCFYYFVMYLCQRCS
jgi:hypothetical protein